jgi:hypothetical protein
MPIEINECDGGIGIIIESRGRITDEEIFDSLESLLTNEKEKFETCKYILVDHSALTKVAIADETVEYISGMFTDISNSNPETIVAMVAYVSYDAGVDTVDRISRMRELFLDEPCWESLVFRTRPQAVRWIKGKVKENFGIDGLIFE